VKTYNRGLKIYNDKAEPNTESETCSEAMGYGMLISAMMAGCEKDKEVILNEQYLFDFLLDNIIKYRAGNGSNLIDWTVGPYGDSDNATDGDMDIAYALLIAAKYNNGWGEHQFFELPYIFFWSENGSYILPVPHGPKYIEVAKGIIEDINNHCLYQNTPNKFQNDWRIRPGYTYDSPPELAHSSRTSDWMPDHLRHFSNNVETSNHFSEAANNIPVMASYIQKNFSPDYGLLPDYITDADQNDDVDEDKYKIGPVKSTEDDIFNEDKHDDDYDYNACRFPLRLAVAAKSPECNNDYSTILNNYLNGISKILKNDDEEWTDTHLGCI